MEEFRDQRIIADTVMTEPDRDRCIMDTKNTKKTEAPHISEAADGSRQFVLHPDDDDLFIRTGRQIIEACRLRISIEVWYAECNAMLENVAEWAKAHAAQVSQCYAVAGGSGIGLFFVPKIQSFDFNLADELADLNRELIQQFNVGTVEIHQVPIEELYRFVVLEESRQVYSDANSAHQSVET